jgi:hypothetical protein
VPSDRADRNAPRDRRRAAEYRRSSSASLASASAISPETEASRSAARRLIRLNNSRGSLSVMFWGCFFFGGCSSLAVSFSGWAALFLDAIGESPTAVQVKLLRFLQEKRFERVGGRQESESDARVLAATNRNPKGPWPAGWGRACQTNRR